jgi:hypothetical protein
LALNVFAVQPVFREDLPASWKNKQWKIASFLAMTTIFMAQGHRTPVLKEAFGECHGLIYGYALKDIDSTPDPADLDMVDFILLAQSEVQTYIREDSVFSESKTKSNGSGDSSEF